MATHNDQDRLCQRDQDLTFLQLLRPDSDTSPLALGKLVGALKANQSVRKVRIFMQQDFFPPPRHNNNDQNNNENETIHLAVVVEEDPTVLVRRQLFHAVGSLRNLEQIKIDSFTGLVTFPVQMLSQTVSRARCLRELELWDLKFAVSHKRDFEDLQRSLQNHPALQKFTIYNCQLEEEVGAQQGEETDGENATTGSSSTSMDPLLYALGSIPTLKQVYITAAAAASSSNFAVAFSCSALEYLCRSKSLEELGLWKFNFPYSHHHQQQDGDNVGDPLSKMVPAIANSNTMRMFEFGKCQLSPTSDRALANMLETNTSLEELDLHLDVGGKYRARNDGSSPYNNTTTDSSCCCNIEATAKALESNVTLKRLKLWGLLSRDNQLALVQMIRNNYVLETFRLLDADRDVSLCIDFFIQLNRNGCQRLLADEEMTVTMADWVDFFAGSAGNDLTIIFYYLSMKPGLCCLG